ncbi:MAG: Asd/ArgC dimerization domain-containing protein [Bryobacteraceae bacterium]
MGGDTLVGREIRDVWESEKTGAELKLIADGDAEAGVLVEMGGEPAVVLPLSAASLDGARVAFLAGATETARRALTLDIEAALVDVTGATEESPRARLRAPQIEPPGFRAPDGAVHVIAHPAAIGLALLLGRIHCQSPVRRAIAHVFEPASERGRGGLTELQGQAVSLLSFKGQPKAVFDAQLAFNLLARYGEEAPEPLEHFERRIERHLASLLEATSRAPMPSIRLIQAPVFHGHSLSLWVEFEQNPGAEALERMLKSGLIDVRAGATDPPDIVGAAGQSGIAAGAVTADRNCARACWIWAALDNLRMTAENAVTVARELL